MDSNKVQLTPSVRSKKISKEKNAEYNAKAILRYRSIDDEYKKLEKLLPNIELNESMYGKTKRSHKLEIIIYAINYIHALTRILKLNDPNIYINTPVLHDMSFFCELLEEDIYRDVFLIKVSKRENISFHSFHSSFLFI